MLLTVFNIIGITAEAMTGSLVARITFAAGWLYILLLKTPLSDELAIIITLLFGFFARLLALRFRLGLPIFNYPYANHLRLILPFPVSA